MLTETTVTKLREMRLSVMANALKDQMSDPQYKSMAFEDRLGHLVDAEFIIERLLMLANSGDYLRWKSMIYTIITQ